jgi:hypothetical protein
MGVSVFRMLRLVSLQDHRGNHLANLLGVERCIKSDRVSAAKTNARYRQRDICQWHPGPFFEPTVMCMLIGFDCASPSGRCGDSCCMRAEMATEDAPALRGLVTSTEETRSTVATSSHQQPHSHLVEHLRPAVLVYGHVQLQWYVPIAASLTRISPYVISPRVSMAFIVHQNLSQIPFFITIQAPSWEICGRLPHAPSPGGCGHRVVITFRFSSQHYTCFV